MCCLHFLAWCVAAGTWAVNWWRQGPAPTGPLYNSARKFIGRLDFFVQDTIHEWTIRVAATASNWFSADIGPWYTITFAGLMLLAGTLQWFLLGRLVKWVAVRSSRRLALVLLGLYGAWTAGAVFMWVAS